MSDPDHQTIRVLTDGAYTVIHIYHYQAGPALHFRDHKVFIGFGCIFGHTSPVLFCALESTVLVCFPLFHLSLF